MRPGTPGFIASRLRSAREARGLTLNALAEIVEVSRQSLSSYESGMQTPGPDTLSALASSLNVPVLFFITPPHAAPLKVQPSYRSYSSATQRARKRSANRLDWFRDIASWLSDFVELPPVTLPTFDIADPLALDNDDIEGLATETRRFFGMGDGPIGNVVQLLESRGVLVTRFALDSDSLDAFSVWDDHIARPLVVLGTDKDSPSRSRLNAAHELGHLILHKGKTFADGDEHKRMEAQAFRFGAAFLVPETPFARELYAVSLAAFLQHKRRWRASAAMLIKRASDLGLILDAQAERLWRYHSSKGYRRAEPFENEIAFEAPSLLRAGIDILIDAHVFTPADILANLPYSAYEIEELCSLDPGTLSGDRGARVVSLKPLHSRARESDTSDGAADVLRFPSQRK